MYERVGRAARPVVVRRRAMRRGLATPRLVSALVAQRAGGDPGSSAGGKHQAPRGGGGVSLGWGVCGCRRCTPSSVGATVEPAGAAASVALTRAPASLQATAEERGCSATRASCTKRPAAAAATAACADGTAQPRSTPLDRPAAPVELLVVVCVPPEHATR